MGVVARFFCSILINLFMLQIAAFLNHLENLMSLFNMEKRTYRSPEPENAGQTSAYCWTCTCSNRRTECQGQSPQNGQCHWSDG